jgi:hypothetical protein
MSELVNVAEAKLAEGRWREAIDELTAANREQRDPWLDRELVRVRHLAFARLAGSDVPSWPPPVDDAVPMPSGSPPEIDAAELTGPVLTRSILGAGCLLVRGLIPTAAADELVAGIDRAFDAFDSVRNGTSYREAKPWFDPFQPAPEYPGEIGRGWVREGGGVLAVDSPPVLYDLLAALAAAGVPDVVGWHLGEPPALSVKKTTLRRVAPDTDTAWHQDGSFMGTGIRTLNVWLALSRCGDDAPGLDVLPKRLDHIVETGTHGAIFEWVAAPDRVEQAAGDVALQRPIFEPGDALLFDHMCMHRTAAGPEMVRERHAVEMWCFAPSLYPADQVPIVM